jgi:[acyl-carrier-protein] S-malonyltransferase
VTDHAAVVHGSPVAKARVDAFLQTVTSAPLRDAGNGATSHDDGQTGRQASAALSSSAERQRRRWATQVVVADELARRACEERNLALPDEVSPAHLLTVEEVGSIVAAALTHSPAARLLLTELEAEQTVPETAVRDYYERNPDRFLTRDALRRGVDPFGRAAPTDFLAYEQVRDGVERDLRRAAGRRAFFDWFDQARADVVYAAGHEHPGDPAHADHEHRH